MIIYPAIDLRAGNCVRLYQGSYTKETIYSSSPLDMAKEFLSKGAKWIHLVDLDGAKNTSASQSPLIKKMLQALPLNIQIGGGIRTESQIEAYFDSGASRIIVGSMAVDSPKTVKNWLKIYGAERFVLALDVSFDEAKAYVMTNAWQKKSCVLFDEILAKFLDFGIQHILCTDISKDGVLNGPNIELYQDLKFKYPQLNIQASGGISSLDDLRSLKSIGVAGAITGRALYEKNFDLSEALSC